MKITMNPNEQVVKAGESTLVSNGSPVKGKLILTTQRIYFKAEPNGSEHEDIEIYPRDIRDVVLFKDRVLFPQGLSIITNSDIENKFLIKKREVWSEMIARMM
ncbi:MAG TPA: GRAM domain-containing protein [Bacteroidales bacterium]|nr:GRAM domain-containing protein [Bacteroidales bacterium]